MSKEVIYNHKIPSSKFKNVNRLYPNSTIKGISEYLGVDGWVKAKSPINSGMTDIIQILEYMDSLGGESVQLVIVDEYGQERRPDYKISELLTKNNSDVQ